MKNEIREVLIKAFKDSTSTTNITFQPKFINQALTQILAIIKEGSYDTPSNKD